MKKLAIVALLLVLGVVGPACGGSSDDALEDQLKEVTSERDALQAQVDASAERYEKTLGVKEAIRAVLDDPGAFGTEEEVADLLATYATPEALMVDDALGEARMRQAWYDTLYGKGLDAEIEVWHQWISDDGSQSGSLWVWKGTNLRGNYFELVGVAIDSHDEDGVVTNELVIYPYDDAYVIEAFSGAGTG
ncbi:MAG: hypothetical protein ACN4GZ_02125 [Acidimicrobiales bacterium]